MVIHLRRSFVLFMGFNGDTLTPFCSGGSTSGFDLLDRAWLHKLDVLLHFMSTYGHCFLLVLRFHHSEWSVCGSTSVFVVGVLSMNFKGSGLFGVVFGLMIVKVQAPHFLRNLGVH